jgi:hypothetical protein
MLQRNQIVLTIPTIDLALLKKIKGGYSEGITPSYCNDHYDDPHWYEDYNDWREGSDEGQQDNHYYDESNDGNNSGNEYGGFIFNNGYSIDPALSVEERAIITSAMEALPLALQMQNVKIIVDAEFVSSLEMANGCFLHQGQAVRHNDGSITVIQEDTIYLTDVSMAAKTLWEESLHQWQYHNCLQTPLSLYPDGIVDNFMEVQVDIIQYMMLFEDFMENGTIFSVSLPYEVSSYIAQHYNEEQDRYDIESIVSFLEDHYQAAGGFDYHWDEVINMFFGGIWMK